MQRKNLPQHGRIAQDSVMIMDLPIGSVADWIAAKIALAKGTVSENLNESTKRDRLRFALDSLASSFAADTALGLFKSNEDKKTVFKMTRDAFIQAYGGNEDMAKRHGLDSRKSLEMLSAALGLGEDGEPIDHAGHMSQTTFGDVKQGIALNRQKGIGIGTTKTDDLIAAGILADKIGAGGPDANLK